MTKESYRQLRPPNGAENLAGQLTWLWLWLLQLLAAWPWTSQITPRAYHAHFSLIGRLGENAGKAPGIKLEAWECFINSDRCNHSGFMVVNETTRSERHMPQLVDVWWKVIVTQLFLTLCDPWTIACQTPVSMEFSRQEYCSGQPIPSPGYLPDSGIKSESPAFQADSLPSEPSGKLT